jgi:hypothetical protein
VLWLCLGKKGTTNMDEAGGAYQEAKAKDPTIFELMILRPK